MTGGHRIGDYLAAHRADIAAAEYRYGLPAGDLLGACYVAVAAAGGDPVGCDIGQIIRSAHYALVRSIAEPTGRGPGGCHSYAVDVDDAGLRDHADPLSVLLARERIAAEITRSRWCRDAAATCREPPARQRGYRGKPTSQRTAERRRAEARTAETAGQARLSGWGWAT